MGGAHAIARFAVDTVHLRPLLSGHATQLNTGDHVAFIAVVPGLRLFPLFCPGSIQSGAHRLEEVGSTNAGFEVPAILRGDFRRTQL